MNPYQYCTKCGVEMDEQTKEIYQSEHEGGPVLCTDCIGAIVHGLSYPIVKAINEMVADFAEAFENLPEASDQ